MRLEHLEPPLGLDEDVPEPAAGSERRAVVVRVGLRGRACENLGLLAERLMRLPSSHDPGARDGQRARSDDVVGLAAVETGPARCNSQGDVSDGFSHSAWMRSDRTLLEAEPLTGGAAAAS